MSSLSSPPNAPSRHSPRVTEAAHRLRQPSAQTPPEARAPVHAGEPRDALHDLLFDDRQPPPARLQPQLVSPALHHLRSAYRVADDYHQPALASDGAATRPIGVPASAAVRASMRALLHPTDELYKRALPPSPPRADAASPVSRLLQSAVGNAGSGGGGSDPLRQAAEAAFGTSFHTAGASMFEQKFQTTAAAAPSLASLEEKYQRYLQLARPDVRATERPA